jgi:GTP diphosphokinase / guanosine-3',5'-bis(diphosphate) 3'-diphosphatase
MSHLYENARQLIESHMDVTALDVPRLYERTHTDQHQPVDSYHHGLAVAHFLREWAAPPEVEAAGLLHPFTWRNLIPVARVAEFCGDRVAGLCQAYREILQARGLGRQTGDPYTLRRVLFYVAAYRDPMLAFLGVADRWDHWEIAKRTDGIRRKRFIEEAQKATLPLLDMLGMGALRAELEEWVLAHSAAQRDRHHLANSLEQATPLLKQACQLVQEELAPRLPQATLTCQTHGLASIYSSPLADHAYGDGAQALAVEVLVHSEADCYLALHMIHKLWLPFEGSFVDHIGSSKLNGHRSLRTTVHLATGQSMLRVTFHICTHEMNEINRWGLAAVLLREQRQVTLPQAWWNQRDAGAAAVQMATIGANADTFHVFSPQGELFGMSRGCTVVDYAYRVHSGLAHQCRQFLVNGSAVAPTTPLRHLDLVELVRDPLAPGPTQAWLEAAKTSRARTDIRRFLRRQGQGALHGQRILEKQLKELEEHYGFDIPKQRLESALNQARRRQRLERVEDLFTEIAAGHLSAGRILHPLFNEELARQVQLPDSLRLRTHQIRIAQCCRPHLGDEIVGRPYHRNGIVTRLKVHTMACARLRQEDLRGAVALGWWLRPPTRTIRRLDVLATDERRLLGDALAAVYAHTRVTLHKVEAESRHGQARMRFTVEADQKTLDEVEAALRSLPNHRIDEVRQMHLLLSEWEELAIPLSVVTVNPYSRLPVSDRSMLFGRQKEINALQELLASGCALVALRGQKRIGKTSLLLHLRDFRLNSPRFCPIYVDFQYFSRRDRPGLFYEIANAVYNGLQSAGRIGDVGAPLWEAFVHDAAHELESYLRHVQSSVGGRLVLLMDEFSITIDAYQRGELDANFFQQWRGLVQQVQSFATFVVVIQQVSYDRLREAHHENPAWQLLEISESLALRPLAEQEIGDLVARPMRSYAAFTPAAVDQIVRLTGGSPFLAQAFCYALTNLISHRQLDEVSVNEVEQVRQLFMSPDENLFSHLLDLMRGLADPVVRCLAQLSGPEGECVRLEALEQAAPNLEASQLQRILHTLAENDILVSVPAKAGVHFRSLLFAQWLIANP